MIRRHRAVERTSLRQTVLDRIAALVLLVVAASGLMSTLPSQSQVDVSRLACRIGSLGLGSCTSSTLTLPRQLNPPRCLVLAHLDAALPEVRVGRSTTASGLAVELDSTRSGDVTMNVGDAGAGALPNLWDGAPRATREVLPGASVPASAEWFLPGGQGADVVLQSIEQRHHREVQRHSSMAVLSMLPDRGHDIPAPTVVYSQVRLGEQVFPTFPGPSAPAGPQPRVRSQVATASTAAAVLAVNRISSEFSVTTPVHGVVDGTPVSGTLSWTRDGSGSVTSVVLAIVSAGALATGEPAPPRGSIDVGYLVVPVRTPDEHDLVEAWLSDPRGFRLGLDGLLGPRAPDPRDHLTSFLTRAATVSILRYTGIGPAQATTRVSQELTARRRVEWPDAKLATAFEIAPQPNLAVRHLTTDQTCAT